MIMNISKILDIPGLELPKVHLNVISAHGGLGDLIARIPALRYIHDNYSHVSMDVYWYDYFVELAQVLLPSVEYPRIMHRKVSDKPAKPELPLVVYDDQRLSSLSLGLVEHGFLVLGDRLPTAPSALHYPKAPYQNFSWLNALSEVELAKPYVVFTPGYTAPNRRWPSVFVNTLARRIREAGLTPVLTGSSQGNLDPEIKREMFLDLWDKTSLIEALAIMQRARAVVGVDNGLLHLAACTSVPIVYGLTNVEAHLRVPVRAIGKTIVLEAQVPCQGCQSKSFAVNHSWIHCPSPRMNTACTLTMTDTRFYSALRALGVVP